MKIKPKELRPFQVQLVGEKVHPIPKMKYQEVVFWLPHLNFVQGCNWKKILMKYPFSVYCLLELPLLLAVGAIGKKGL